VVPVLQAEAQSTKCSLCQRGRYLRNKKKNTRDEYPCSQWNSNLWSQQSGWWRNMP